MKINQLKSLLKRCVEANVYIPFLLVGSRGVGKSQVISQVAKESGLQLIDLRLAQQEAGDLIGLPYQRDGKTYWAKPSWFPEPGTRGILFFDELNRAPNDVRQAVFQIVLERTLHTHKLPDGWFIHAAINPDNGNYQVEALDPAMLRRFDTIEVTPDVDVWLEWAKSGNIEDIISEFVSANRKLLYVPEECKIDAAPTPDSYRMLNTLLRAGVVNKEDQMEVFRGLLGNEAAIALIKWLDKNYMRPVSGKEVLEDYKSVRDKVKAQENDTTNATVDDLVAIVKNMKELNKATTKAIADFMVDLPKEAQASLISKLPTTARRRLFEDDSRVSEILLTIREGGK